MSAKPVAVFRFSDTEGPGHFATFLEANRIPWRLYKLDEGEAVPASSEPLMFSSKVRRALLMV